MDSRHAFSRSKNEEIRIVLNLTKKPVSVYDCDGNMITLLPIKKQDLPSNFMDSHVAYLVDSSQCVDDETENNLVVINEECGIFSGRGHVPVCKIIKKINADSKGKKIEIHPDYIDNYRIFDRKGISFKLVNV